MVKDLVEVMPHPGPDFADHNRATLTICPRFVLQVRVEELRHVMQVLLSCVGEARHTRCDCEPCWAQEYGLSDGLSEGGSDCEGSHSNDITQGMVLKALLDSLSDEEEFPMCIDCLRYACMRATGEGLTGGSGICARGWLRHVSTDRLLTCQHR